MNVVEMDGCGVLTKTNGLHGLDIPSPCVYTAYEVMDMDMVLITSKELFKHGFPLWSETSPHEALELQFQNTAPSMGAWQL